MYGALIDLHRPQTFIQYNSLPILVTIAEISSFMLFFITLVFKVMAPAISMAPPKDISASLYGGHTNVKRISFSGSPNEAGLMRGIQIADAKLGTFDIYGQVDFAPFDQILDVAFAAMFWSTWNVPRAIVLYLLLDIALGIPRVGISGSGGRAITRWRSVVLISSASRLFHSAKISTEGALPS